MAAAGSIQAVATEHTHEPDSICWLGRTDDYNDDAAGRSGAHHSRPADLALTIKVWLQHDEEHCYRAASGQWRRPWTTYEATYLAHGQSKTALFY